MTNLASKTRLGPGAPAPRRGFTLIELIIVMTIIGIIVSFILIAARDGVRQAEVRATQALILKLEGGLNDRLDALMQFRPEPNYSHGYLAGVYFTTVVKEPDGGPLMSPPAILPSGAPNPAARVSARAQAFALADYLKSEMPDVFVLDAQALSGSATYPMNFGARPFPGDPVDSSLGVHANYILPLGHMVQGPRTAIAGETSGYGDGNLAAGFFESSNPQLGLAGRGIYGASYAVAAGIYKNLGYKPEGYDMVDNNGNGLIDEWGEGVDSGNQADVLARLANHRHETARAEMLYAILVEGQGPLGAVFSPDDFSDREVKDTDGDGLPEFVDAWGKPLQFFLWPTLYHSDAQRGQNLGTDMDPNASSPPMALLPPYASIFETRERDPLDPGNSLTAPAWWLASQNAAYPPELGDPSKSYTGGKSTTKSSGGVEAFERYFYRLTEPMEVVAPSSGRTNPYWDRGGYTGLGYRRAFFTKPLILSGGPDQRAGVALFAAPTLDDVMVVESQAARFWPPDTINSSNDWVIPQSKFDVATSPESFNLIDAGQDDITNHNVTGAAGSGG